MSHKDTKIDIELTDKLIELYDNRDFVVGVLTLASTQEDRQLILDYINSESDKVTDSTVTLLATKLHRDRKKTQ